MEKKQFTTEVGGKTLTLEVSHIAEQANAAVIAKYGETVVLATAVMTATEESVDHLPLKVDYEERFYAVGKVLGSRFVRREGKPSDEAILSGRLVDRTIRPLFDQRLRREMQVVLTVLAFDEEHDPDFPGLVAASAALHISDIPWNGPAAAVRVAKVNGKLVVNPKNSEFKKGEGIFELFAAGPKGKINMVELAGEDAPETEILEAFKMAQKEIDNLTAFQEKMREAVGKPKAEVKLAEADPELKSLVQSFLGSRLEEAMYVKDKLERQRRTAALRTELFDHLKSAYEAQGKTADIVSAEFFFESTLDELVHKKIIEESKRPDGRALDEVRALSGEVGLFERTHGSALFVRGNTQALAITTLAAPGSEQVIETMETVGKRRFLLHYNFPPFSVGEIGRLGNPGRREIGHGALAYKAVEPLIPTQDQFPYTIRVVSEILSSNGSSSMATVCASVLSLMDAGVPIKKMAAGIAMGLMSDAQGQWKVLTDIQGPEDHYGDMDFKVAGTETGVNAIQLDTKIEGLTHEVIVATLTQARAAREHILKAMKNVLSFPRESLSRHAPVITQLTVPVAKIGMVIGPGGKMINGLIEKYALASIDIEEDGRVFVAGTDRAKMEAAVAEIKSLTREFKVGEVVEGPIIKTLEFGAIVDLGGDQDGMIHVSELKNGFVKEVTDVVKVGDFVRAKIIRVDPDGRIGLSLKQMQ